MIVRGFCRSGAHEKCPGASPRANPARGFCVCSCSCHHILQRFAQLVRAYVLLMQLVAPRASSTDYAILASLLRDALDGPGRRWRLRQRPKRFRPALVPANGAH